MVPCSNCQRHVRSTDSTCPFCGASRGSTFTRAFNAFGGAVTAVVLAACYGPPPDTKIDDSSPDSAVTDFDADGSPANVDCDDNNAARYPGNTEDCSDKLDNDCDDLVDTGDSDCVGG
jgi:hypothetical protein